MVFIIYKKTHRDRVEVIIVKETCESDSDDDDPRQGEKGVPPPQLAAFPHMAPMAPTFQPRFGGPHMMGARPPMFVARPGGPVPMGGPPGGMMPPRMGFPGMRPPAGGVMN